LNQSISHGTTNASSGSDEQYMLVRESHH
jgi:hypothetical protein